ncbi:MAG: ADP-ribosylglycohydrolase family protein [Hormoscilla sp.]
MHDYLIDKSIIMRYTIESRFQGAFLGAAVGEMLGISITSRSWHQLGSPPANWWDLDIGQLSRFLPGWGSYAVRGCKSLIAGGPLEGNMPVGNEATATTLPYALFFHEDAEKLRRKLNQLAAGQLSGSVGETKDATLAIGYCLLQIALEKFDHRSIIPQIINYIQSDGELTSELEQVQTLLLVGASLETASSVLSNSIAKALYCFATTPEDFRLSVMRALRIARAQPQLVAALTGAMSGAYNSIVGIPVSWRMAMAQMSDKILLPCWGVTSGAEIVQLASNLFAAWSGVYWPTQIAKSPLGNAVAVPRIQPARTT